MLLYDRIKVSDFITVVWSKILGRLVVEPLPSKSRDIYSRFVGGCVPFEITNVAEFLYLGSDREVWDTREDFPRPVPPFQLSWFEWKPSKVSISKDCGVVPLNPEIDRVGVALRVSKFSEDRARVVGVPCIYYRGRPCELLVAFTFGLELKTGAPVSLLSPGSPPVNYIIPGMDQSAPKDVKDKMLEFGESGYAACFPMMLALSFLNCRNVVTHLVKTPEALAKSHRKKGHAVPADYRVIEIQPMRQRILKETGEAGYSRKAAAIIRGHFKNYSEGHGLFGKLHGMYWWDQRITGDISGLHYELSHAGGGLDRAWGGRV